jgi:hypothetical protein
MPDDAVITGCGRREQREHRPGVEGVRVGMAMTVRTVVQKYLMDEAPTSRNELVDRMQRQDS